MCADRNLRITYINPSLEETLRALETHLRVSVDNVIGASLEIFLSATKQRLASLTDPNSPPLREQVKIGPETAEVLVRPMYSQK